MTETSLEIADLWRDAVLHGDERPPGWRTESLTAALQEQVRESALKSRDAWSEKEKIEKNVEDLERKIQDWRDWVRELSDEIKEKRRMIERQSEEMGRYQDTLGEYEQLIEVTKRVGDRRVRVVLWTYNLLALAILFLAFLAR